MFPFTHASPDTLEVVDWWASSEQGALSDMNSSATGDGHSRVGAASIPYAGYAVFAPVFSSIAGPLKLSPDRLLNILIAMLSQTGSCFALAGGSELSGSTQCSAPDEGWSSSRVPGRLCRQTSSRIRRRSSSMASRVREN